MVEFAKRIALCLIVGHAAGAVDVAAQTNVTGVNTVAGQDLSIGTDGNQYLTLKSATGSCPGCLGIGTANPLDILHISKSSGVVHLDTAAANQQFNVNFDDNATPKWALYKTTGNDLRLFDYGASKDVLLFRTGGAIAIGTSSVIGGVPFQIHLLQNEDFLMYNSPQNGVNTLNIQATNDAANANVPLMLTGAPIWLNSASGVGISTATPQATLDIWGSIRAYNTSNITAGGACSPEGSMAYDMANHQPVYCNSGLAWASYSGSGTFTPMWTTIPWAANSTITPNLSTYVPAGAKAVQLTIVLETWSWGNSTITATLDGNTVCYGSNGGGASNVYAWCDTSFITSPAAHSLTNTLSGSCGTCTLAVSGYFR